MVREMRPDAVIVDVGLPGPDGIELTKQLRTISAPGRSHSLGARRTRVCGPCDACWRDGYVVKTRVSTRSALRCETR